MEAQIERFAPGFRDRVRARSVRVAAEAERENPNLLGGDVSGGAATLRQTLFRPVMSWNPYRTPIDGVYLCSASTPPGGGVHGMCGVAARAGRDAGAPFGLIGQLALRRDVRVVLAGCQSVARWWDFERGAPGSSRAFPCWWW